MSAKNFNSYIAHPWHGIVPGRAEESLKVYIEMIPQDTVKYEVDKTSGHLLLDRPQKYSSLCPSLYGFIPRTYCGELTAQRAMTQTGRENIVGDGDPLDICVLTERVITNSPLLVNARPVGGLRMLDSDEADDKIIAILVGDPVYKDIRDISEVPKGLMDRIIHYFLTYKEIPEEGDAKRKVEIAEVYGVEEARNVIECSMRDYKEEFI